MAIIKYKHNEGSCEFKLDVDVNHTKSIYFKCPHCGWISEFIPENESIYDATDNFELNSFKVLDESLFAPVKSRKTTSKRAGTKRNKVLKMKLPKNVKDVNRTIYSFNYKDKQKLMNNGNSKNN
jgi:phage terminase large subunit GpA-like protein